MGLVGVKYLLVNKIAVAGLQIDVAEIINKQIALDSTHDRHQIVKLLGLYSHLDLQPLGNLAEITAKVVFIYVFCHCVLLISFQKLKNYRFRRESPFATVAKRPEGVEKQLKTVFPSKVTESQRDGVDTYVESSANGDVLVKYVVL